MEKTKGEAMAWTSEPGKEDRPPAVTWGEMCEIDPRLAVLWSTARTRCPQGVDWEDWQWIKPELSALVGWDSTATDPRLRTADAWEVAVDKITHEAPPKPKRKEKM